MQSTLRPCATPEADSSHCHKYSDELIQKIGGDIAVEVVRTVKDEQFGLRMEKTRESLLRSGSDPFDTLPHIARLSQEPLTIPFINAGMEPVIDRIVNKNELNIPNRASFIATRTLPPTDEGVGSKYPSLDAFVRANSRGTIEIQNPEFLDEVVFNIAIANPACSIIVVTRDKKQILSLYKRLISDHPSLIGRLNLNFSGKEFRPHEDKEHAGVILSTFDGLLTLDDFPKSHIVLLADARQSTFSRANHAVCQANSRFKLFGIQYRNSQLNLQESAMTMRWFGPRKIALNSHGRVRRTVGVHWEENTLVRLGRKPKPLFWANQKRNEMISDLALRSESGNAGESSKTVVVLTNNPIQFGHLADLLEGWRLEIGDKQILRTVSHRHRKRVREQRGNWHVKKNCLALTEGKYSRKIRGWEFDVLIWAGGTTCIRKIPESWLYQRDGGVPRPLHIIDIADTGTQFLNRCTRKRKLQFAERDIFSMGLDAATGRIDHFLSKIGRI